VSRTHVRVRPAEFTDVAELVLLLKSTDLQLGALGARVFKADTLEHLPERVARMLSGTERDLLVAIDDATGNVVGMIVVSDDSVGEVTPIPVLNVTHLVVSPQHRRRGVGRALLAATVHLADQRRIENIVATAVSGSRDANRYLARLGFAPLVVRRIAPTSVLRRSLGIADAGDRLALLRRARIVRSGQRAVSQV
jgi:ribosomal protein S18 acetylase RimI-like enzyme